MSLPNDHITSHFNSLKLKREKNEVLELMKIINEKDFEIKNLKQLANDIQDCFIILKDNVPKIIETLMDDSDENHDWYLGKCERAIIRNKEYAKKL